jgi:hypothetical protein
VGLNYEAKGRFRSRVLIHVGQPIEPLAVARPGESSRETVRTLTAAIARGLGEVTGGGGSAWDEALWPHPSDENVPSLVRNRIVRLLRPPVDLVAALFNWIPYRVAGLVSARFAQRPDDPATYKMLTGLVVFPIAWILETAFAAGWGAICAFAVAVLGPLTARMALALRDL